MNPKPEQADEYYQWCMNLQNAIIKCLENLDCTSLSHADNNRKSATFKKKPWDYHQFGGGIIGVLKNGRVFEKAGVNVSQVWGEFSKEFRDQIPGANKNPNFWACGLSLVIHPRNPYVPIIHMNVRHVMTSKRWFGGGIDLTPALPNDSDTQYFHNTLKSICDQHDSDYYPQYKKWADDYFYIPHRKETRGVGGIFYDYLEKDFATGFAFNCDVGQGFNDLYTKIVSNNLQLPYGEAEIKAQLKKRSRYVEFNLLYDRGTHFGLKTGGNPEAILMSMPPLAAWE